MARRAARRRLACARSASAEPALIALGWAAALRSVELAALDAQDLHFEGDLDGPGSGGVVIWLGRSKADQSGRGQWVAVPWATPSSLCPARLALRYTRIVTDGRLFRAIDRHGRPQRRLDAELVTAGVRTHVTRILQTDAAAYGSHSLRAGFQTPADDAGADPARIGRQMRQAQRFRDTRRVCNRPADAFVRTPFDAGWW